MSVSARRNRLSAPVAARLAFATVAVLAVSGCSKVVVHRLTDDRFPSAPADASIRLYENKVLRPHREIAFIDSQALPDESAETREKQLLQITDKARDLGAEAVHDIRFLKEPVEGLIVDQNVPFRAYKQGRYTLYFIRGTAIVYTNDEPESPPIKE